MYRKDNGYKYDYLGNVTCKPNESASNRTEFEYNPDNLLDKVTDVLSNSPTSTDITWDADQQRLKLAKGSDTWEMVYDTVAGIPAVLLAKDYVSSTTSYEYYVRTPDGQLLASFTDGGTPTPHYYHFDNHASTVLVTDGSATVSASKTYDAWGVTLAGTGTAVPYGYVGELGYYAHDSQGTALSGLLQLGVRVYDPELGWFTQRDLLSDEEGSPYSYVGGKPSVYADPSGMLYIDCHPPFIHCGKRPPPKRKNPKPPKPWNPLPGPIGCAVDTCTNPLPIPIDKAPAICVGATTIWLHKQLVKLEQDHDDKLVSDCSYNKRKAELENAIRACVKYNE